MNFEERLLAELRAVVEERAAHAGAGAGVERNRRYATVSLHSRLAAGGGRRLAPRLVFGGAAVAAVAAAVLAVSSGTDDTSSAFAVEPQGDGEVRVEISSLSDAEGLEKALGEAGIKADVNYLAAGMACREPRFTPNSGGGGPERSKSSSSVRQTDSGVVFTITRSGIDPGDTLLVTASPGPEGIGDMLSVQIAEGAVSACVPVAAPELPPGAVTQSSGPQNGGPQKGLSQSGG
ncbi:MAG TPA: hypothetical protein VJL81_05815 [Solirubrobacterales bacterium]|nr:hypothetical protein [Solirubrobacterales bacterium]